MDQFTPATNPSTALLSIPGDPIQVQMHTLSNGLKLFLTINKHEPRVYTEIAVRVGSKHDPADTTGLAHYFEHMMFKGTDRLGSLNWEEEKALLDEIESLFERHRAEQDPEQKKRLYAEIDRLSNEAAQFAAANEYDKLVSAMGAKGTNAYTWVEQTVYVNDIPSNELERWFALESERFRRPILRLFHTELETVFEEYNISQDKDFRKTLKAMQETLTPTHPYGTQTTLGRGEDLKNPSQTNIYKFFDTYYIPNNMAIVMAGDFDPAHAIRLAERYFGKFEAKPLPKFRFKPQPELSSRTLREVYGQESPWVEIGWRLPGAKSKEASLYLPLIAGILHNYQAGLFDLNIVQKQQLLEAYAYPRVYEDFSSLLLMAKPREGQSLEDVEKILMREIENLRNGKFEDWLLEAVIKDMKISEIRAFEKNQGRANTITNAFVLGIEWSDIVKRWKKLAKVTKEQLVDFAQNTFRDNNCAVVYKHTGEDQLVMKVEKPPITPIEVNREGASSFASDFLQWETPDVAPTFVDFKKVIQTKKLSGGVPLKVVQDKKSKMFRLHYCYDMGKLNDRRLAVLAGYFPFLGTSKYSPTEIQQAMYRLGVSFGAECREEHFFLSLTGLEESLEQAVKLLEHILEDAQPNPAALENLVADILLRRENNKKDKRTILSKGLLSYAKYGPENPFTDKLSAEQMHNLSPEELVQTLKGLRQYKHEVFYFGAKSGGKIRSLLQEVHPSASAVLPPVQAKRYLELGSKKDKVYFVHFPSVQIELLMLSKGSPKFNLEEFVLGEWYNQYFGYGLSSIVFQEIRESKALAYSAYVHAGSPTKKNKAHWLQAYVGTQPDKLRDAVEAFQAILEDMPVSLPQMEHARKGVLKQIAAGRINQAELYWAWRGSRDRGYLNRDLRQDIYQTIEKASASDLVHFQQKHIKGRHYTWLVLGERDRIDFAYLKKMGKVTELSLEDIFGY
ncbi:MAG TPA: insulinase family protein [Saprospiraceae bacterium]|nr:insulinase family protein [Saprospiraceae bacterium]